MLGNVLPGVATNNAVCREFGNVESSSDRCTGLSTRGTRSYLSYIVFGKHCCRISLPSSRPSLARSVLGIILRGAKKEMFGIYTAGIIAMVANRQSVSYRPIGKFPGETMCANYIMSAQAKTPITFVRDSAHPFVAAVGHYLDAGIEPSEVFRGILGLHVNPPEIHVYGAGAAIPGLSLLYHGTQEL